MRQIFHPYCPLPVVFDPTAVSVFPGRILVASGWKPGFSSDYDAVLLANKFSAEELINLSNIANVYTEDPKVNPDAAPIDSISWKDFRNIVGDIWVPGKNIPFDPIAAKLAADSHLRVGVASGSEMDNFNRILTGKCFVGTVIGPD